MKKIICFFSCCLMAFNLFGATEQKDSYLASIEEMVETLSAGKKLKKSQEAILFPEVSTGNFGRFLALNYKDKRIWRLRELVLSSNFPKRRKEYISGMLSREGRGATLQWICYNGLELPPILPDTDWDAQFQTQEPPLSKEKQLEVVRLFANAGKKFSAALKSERGKEVDFILPYFRKFVECHGDVLALRPPKLEEDKKEIAEKFLLTLAEVKESMTLSDEYFFSQGKNLYLLAGINCERLFNTDSYLLDYALFKERERILKERRERERSKWFL